MSTPINPSQINPTVINSLGSSTNFSAAASLIGSQYQTDSSTFTDFMNALASQLPTEVQLTGNFSFATTGTPPSTGVQPGGPPTVDVTSVTNHTTAGSNVPYYVVSGTITTTINVSNANFDANTLISGFLSQFSSSNPFENNPNNQYPAGIDTYLGTFQSDFLSYLNNYYSTNAVGQLPAVFNAESPTSQALQNTFPNLSISPQSVTWSASAVNSFTSPNSQSILSGLQSDLSSSSSLFGSNSSINSIWTNPSVTGTASSGNEANLWFNSFLSNFQYPPNGAPVTTSYFLSQAQAQAQQNVITATLTSLGSGQTIPSGMQQYLLQYQTVYDSLFPNSNAAAQQTAFSAALQSFYTTETQKYGPYVTPSQAFGDFVSSMQKQYISNQPTDFTSLSSQDAGKTLIINNIYALISSMVNSIQEVAAAQSTRLVLLTNWQQAYSNTLTQVPTFLAATYPYLDPSVRTDLNGTFNQNKLTNLQTDQSLIGDDAKALQSNINQANDAVSQQANMAQSLLQELNTILSSIFK